MGNKSAYRTIILVLILSTLACSFSTVDLLSGADLPPDVLFQDDFSDSSSGWNQQTSPEFETGYKDDGFVISIKADSTMAWANPGLGFSDVLIETEATKIQGNDDNSFGIICRFTETETAASFYFFAIGSDGFYGIGKVVDGKQAMLSSENLEYNEAIHQGEFSNRLQAECAGPRLVLYANGQILAEVTDGELTSGDVGLMAGTFDTPGTDIFFDNFVVKKPVVRSEP